MRANTLLQRPARALTVDPEYQPIGNTSVEFPRRIVIANELPARTVARSCSRFVTRTRPTARMTSFGRKPLCAAGLPSATV